MESLERLHQQLDSLEELRTIVKTMKALSAASIRQYEQAVESLADYHRSIRWGLGVVLEDIQSHHGLPAVSPPSSGVGVIVFGSDHGLCGRFNEEIAEHANDLVASLGGHARLLAVGARAEGSLEHVGLPVDESLFVPSAAPQITDTVQQILIRIDAWREDREITDVYLLYNRHSGARGYASESSRLLPIDLAHIRELESAPWSSRRLPLFTMDRDRLLSRLLRQYLFVSLFRACSESLASEHSSRLEAMQSAQRNLDERLDEVTQVFRRARQDAITSELLDVVAGFEATTGPRS